MAGCGGHGAGGKALRSDHQKPKKLAIRLETTQGTSKPGFKAINKREN